MVKTVFATEPPTLSSPSDSSNLTSSTLSWQTPAFELANSNPYRVQVADNPSFTSPNKDYYTDNTNYTPALDPGTWYWRVKVKDSSNNWSEWSNSWSFTLSNSTPTSSPTSSPTSAPTSTPSPSDNALGGSPSQSNQFTITAPPSAIRYNEPISITVTLSNLQPNSIYYLKGAFVKSGSSNYFGQTYVGSDWVKNNVTFSSQVSINTDASGNWTGSLQAMPDYTDSGFSGAGSYIFKVARYNSTGSGPTWSSDFTLSILDAPSPTASTTTTAKSTSSPSPSPKNTASSTPTATKSSNNNSYASSEDQNQNISLPNLFANESTVAGAATESATINLAKPLNNVPNWYIIGGITGSVLALGSLAYFARLKLIKHAVPHLK